MMVLVVEADVQALDRLAGLLQGQALPGELEIHTAASAEEGVKAFHRYHPDLILAGTRDLDKVGRELTRRIRAGEGHRHTGIIFLDDRPKDDSTLSVECLEMGADDFLRQGCTATELMARVRAVLRLKAMTDELRSANHRLQVLSYTDELTGMANMRSFNQSYADLMRRCRKGRIALGVMMIDLDHFKSVNDTTNHLVGSHVIGEAGRLMRQLVQGKTDVAARYGGDEFVIACEMSCLRDLEVLGEKLRAVIADAAFERDGFRVRVTASIGGAWASRGFRGRAEDLIKAADLMLYRSKNLGRNRVNGMELSYPALVDGVRVRAAARDEEEEERELPLVVKY